MGSRQLANSNELAVSRPAVGIIEAAGTRARQAIGEGCLRDIDLTKEKTVQRMNGEGLGVVRSISVESQSHRRTVSFGDRRCSVNATFIPRMLLRRMADPGFHPRLS